MTTSGPGVDPRAAGVSVNEDELTVDLADGRRVSVPLAWFPRLLHAAASQRANWRLLRDGHGINWPDLDEISASRVCFVEQQLRERLAERCVGLWLADWTVVVYALAGAVAWHVGVRPLEERDLEQRFGERYRHYRSAVPLWWPRRSRYVAPR